MGGLGVGWCKERPGSASSSLITPDSGMIEGRGLEVFEEALAHRSYLRPV